MDFRFSILETQPMFCDFECYNLSVLLIETNKNNNNYYYYMHAYCQLQGGVDRLQYHQHQQKKLGYVVCNFHT